MTKRLVSPGHNSAIYDEERDKYFLLFHTRFEKKGEMHQVRVHQMLFNDDGWPVVLPYRYTGETQETYKKSGSGRWLINISIMGEKLQVD